MYYTIDYTYISILSACPFLVLGRIVIDRCLIKSATERAAVNYLFDLFLAACKNFLPRKKVIINLWLLPDTLAGVYFHGRIRSS